MRIGVDARELGGHPTGVGRYLSGLLCQWANGDAAEGHEFLLYLHKPLDGVALHGSRFATRVVAGRGGALWEQKALPAAIARDRLDVFFSPGYTAPLLARVPLVVAIHDASFAAHPEWFSAREGLRRRILSRRAAAAARAVITISEFSKSELVDLLRVAPKKIHVIPPGLTAPGGPMSLEPGTFDPARRRAVGGEREGHRDAEGSQGAGSRPDTGGAYTILYVGSIFNRRHVPDLIHAAGQIARTHAEVSLDLVGDNRSHPYQDIAALIERQRLDRRIRWHRYIADVDLRILYESARAFAFLSEYEGLGLTPLEALAAGTPAVLLDTAVARESCGGAALYVPRGDAPATVDALTRLLFDDGTRHTLLAAGPAALARFDWATSARQTLAVIVGAG